MSVTKDNSWKFMRFELKEKEANIGKMPDDEKFEKDMEDAVKWGFEHPVESIEDEKNECP